jgi:hypothetical protein
MPDWGKSVIAGLLIIIWVESRAWNRDVSPRNEAIEAWVISSWEMFFQTMKYPF